MPELGTIESLGFDSEDHERKRRLDGIAFCDCGAEIELWAETEAWTEAGEGSEIWVHSEFGGAMGVCETCHLLYAEQPRGEIEVYDLRKPVELTEEVPCKS